MAALAARTFCFSAPRSSLACRWAGPVGAPPLVGAAVLELAPGRVALDGLVSRRRFASASSDGPEAQPFLRKKQKVAPRTRDGIPLPEGWEEHRSPSKGIYYAHKATGVTQFDFPMGPPSQEQVQFFYRERYGDRMGRLHPGAKVLLKGLTFDPQLNGKTGVCERWEPDGKYVRVKLESGQVKAVKPENLHVLQAAASRVKPQRLIEAGVEDTTKTKSSKWTAYAFLIVVSGSCVAYLALNFGWYQLGMSMKDPSEVTPLPGGTIAPLAGLQALPPLPAGWKEHMDSATGRYYYWQESDPATTTTWVRPKL